MKLVKIVLLAVVLSIIIYYTPSIFIGFTASTVGAGYKSIVTTLATSTVTEEALRAYAETILQTNTTEASPIPSIIKAEGLKEYYQVFIYNVILSMVIAMIVFTFTRRMYK
ncbi:MAG: hypothetical protein LZ168_05445 [Thaumarchaeota archaeon]|nr:hypothetical protein [Candidatus Geocrenenecus arthurdayi]MCL7389730.1 hypothetical protein [Candidatus Geocrenenecus arthurdayi]MCL7402211.1 hypothetical protein [Candidatus Geocrenenecus arthurdayi]